MRRTRRNAWLVVAGLGALVAALPLITTALFGAAFEGNPGRRVLVGIVCTVLLVPVFGRAHRFLRECPRL